MGENTIKLAYFITKIPKILQFAKHANLLVSPNCRLTKYSNTIKGAMFSTPYACSGLQDHSVTGEERAAIFGLGCQAEDQEGFKPTRPQPSEW